MKSIAVLLIFLQLTPAYATSAKLEWVRVGDYSSQGAKALPFLEKEVQRVIENSTFVHARVVNEGLTISNEEYSTFGEVQELKRLVSKLKHANLNENEREVLSKLQSKWIGAGRGGKRVQDSLFAEAFSHWKKGEKPVTDRLLKKALRIHPEGEGEYLGDWSETEKEDSTRLAFSLFLENKRAQITRGCEVLISGQEKDQNIFVNGFEVAFKKKYHFQTGQLYRVSKGPGFEPSLISCGHQAKFRVALSDVRVAYFDVDTLILRADGLFFSRENGKKTVLDLYSSLGNLQKEFLDFEYGQSMESLITDAELHAMARRHHLTQGHLAMLPSVRPNPQPLIPSLTEGTGTRWYNNWVFWTITGAVAAGTVTYLLTKDSGNTTVGTNVTGIKISLE